MKIKNCCIVFHVFIATGFGTGLLPQFIGKLFPYGKSPSDWTGSGLIGTVLGFIFVAVGYHLTSINHIIILLGLTAASIYVSGVAEDYFKTKDAQKINVDEIIGYFWAVAFLPIPVDSQYRMTVLLIAFVLFRLFDVFKVPYRNIQNLKGGLGVVADDVLAGLTANLLLQVSLRIMLTKLS